MMRCRVALFCVASLAPQLVLAKETIKIASLSASAYELRLTSDRELSVEEAQSQLAETASKTCGTRPASFGRYSFESSAPIERAKQPDGTQYVFVQRLDCSLPDSGPTLSPTPPLSEADRASIEAEVRTLTDSHFGDLAAKRYSTAYARLSGEMQAMQPLQEWESAQREFHSTAGERTSGGISRVTIYVDPPSAPAPGIYVATDYEFSYRNVPFQCGYIIWYRHGTDAFRLSREETGFVDAKTAKGLSEEQLAEIRQQYRCVDL
jgi:hypothetical protein